jgi:glyoxylase-like metal-dependent hydrolase (beta-lactamase superfamily II)
MSFEPAREVASGVFLVETGYLRPHLAACYVVRGSTSAAVIETGNAATVPRILAALEQAGIPRAQVSHVIVTHVHLDHAGGAGALMRELPGATLVVHPRGARHMVDPAKLWAGTVTIYGAEATQQLYGDPIPIPADRVVEAPDGFAIDLGDRPLRFLDAPGHAKHHFVVHDPVTEGFFTGDSFGISYRETDTARGPFLFASTTPVQFDPPALHATVDRMLAARPRRMYLVHYGMLQGDIAAFGTALHGSIDDHVAAAQAAPSGPGRRAAIKATLSARFLTRLAEHGSTLSREAALALYDNDLELNASGLEFWLDGSARG